MPDEIRLAALDMDGTLLNSEHELTPYTCEVIRRAHEKGRLIALATGRCLAELVDLVRRMEGVRYLICENGACLYDLEAGRTLKLITIKPDVVERVMTFMSNFDAITQFFMHNQSYLRVSVEDDFSPYHVEGFHSVFEKSSVFVPDLFERCRAAKTLSVEKISVYSKTEEDRLRVRAFVEGLGLLASDSIGIGLEITPVESTKANGLMSLCDIVGVPVEQTMAVGDGGNDVEILQAAGWSVAMGNAIPEVTALADAVTDDNDHDGAAKAIEKYML